MEIRPLTTADVDLLSEIDATIDSSKYVHVERTGEGLAGGWTLQERSLREKVIRPMPIDDELRFSLKQVANGIEDGMALMAEHDGLPVALLLAIPDFTAKTLRIRDLRVNFEHRRQGLATALLYQAISLARERELRAVMAEATTDNFPAAQLLGRCGFELAGLDLRRWTNHDLVKENVTLFWYIALD